MFKGIDLNMPSEQRMIVLSYIFTGMKTGDGGKPANVVTSDDLSKKERKKGKKNQIGLAFTARIRPVKYCLCTSHQALQTCPAWETITLYIIILMQLE